MKINIWYILISLIIIISLFDQCTKRETVTNTVTKTEYITDTIVKTVIKEVDKPIYYETKITEKGKDSIIYVDVPTKTSKEAKQYTTTLESNDAKANLTITSETKPIDIQGVITYPEKTTTITKYKDNSGLFIYTSMPITQEISPEFGLMAQIKNKLILGGGIQYNNFTNKADVKVTLAVKF